MVDIPLWCDAIIISTNLKHSRSFCVQRWETWDDDLISIFMCVVQRAVKWGSCLFTQNNSIIFSQFSYQFIHLVRWWYHISENSEWYVMSYYEYEAFTLTTSRDECVNAINCRRRLCSFVTIRCYSWTCRVRKLGKSQIFLTMHKVLVCHTNISAAMNALCIVSCTVH